MQQTLFTPFKRELFNIIYLFAFQEFSNLVIKDCLVLFFYSEKKRRNNSLFDKNYFDFYTIFDLAVKK